MSEDDELVILLFDKHFSNYLPIASKYSNTMLLICKISLKKYNMLKADEDGLMLFPDEELLLYIFKYKWNRVTGHLLAKISNFVQFNNKKHLLQCKVKYNVKTMKI